MKKYAQRLAKSSPEGGNALRGEFPPLTNFSSAPLIRMSRHRYSIQCQVSAGPSEKLLIIYLTTPLWMIDFFMSSGPFNFMQRNSTIFGPWKTPENKKVCWIPSVQPFICDLNISLAYMSSSLIIYMQRSLVWWMCEGRTLERDRKDTIKLFLRQLHIFLR